MDHVHGDITKLEQYFCDRKNCSRSEQGYKATLARMGRSAAAPPPPAPSSAFPGGAGGGSSSSSKDSGIGPFLRKDHFKAHLRDIHKEPLWKRDPRSDKHWLDNKIVNQEWWRCPKCLARVHVQKNRWQCGGCGLALEPDVVRALERKMKEARQKKLSEPSSSSSSSSRNPR